jgi:hypothetical protein
VPGSLGLFTHAPLVGIWKEIQAVEYFNKSSQHYLDVVKATYPDAILSEHFAVKLEQFLSARGVKASDTILNSVTCSDDVNASEFANIVNIGQTPPALNNFLGPFMGGGLAGYPHTGLLGLQAFQSHATTDTPNDGPLLIINMPHIGITQQADLVAANDHVGRMLRKGKSSATGDNTCGAVATAIADTLNSGGEEPDPTLAIFVNNYQRYQLALITYASFEYYDTHSYSENMIQATELIRAAGYTLLHDTLLPSNFASQKNLYLFSGTFINVDDGWSSCIDVNSLAVLNSGTWTDLTTSFKNTL